MCLPPSLMMATEDKPVSQTNHHATTDDIADGQRIVTLAQIRVIVRINKRSLHYVGLPAR